MKKLLLTVCILASCKNSPPPVSQGKCLVDVWDGSIALTQVCTWEGWSWSCVRHDDGDIRCTRTGEASGERR